MYTKTGLRGRWNHPRTKDIDLQTETVGNAWRPLLTIAVASKETLAFYERMLRHLPRTEKKVGLVREGFFVKDDVAADSVIIEYIGNRISGRNLRRMNGSFDHHGLHPDVQVAVPSENTVIDPRGVGNIAQKVNHHCSPNARLMELQICDKRIVRIVAITEIKAGDEVFIDYHYNRRDLDEVMCDGVEYDEEEDDEHEFDMELGATRNHNNPILISACDSPDCCLTL